MVQFVKLFISKICGLRVSFLTSIMLTSERAEISVRGDENGFYCCIALLLDKERDQRHAKLRRLCACLIEANPQVFEQFLFTAR